MEPDQSQHRQHGLDGAGRSLFDCALSLQIVVLVALSIRLVSRKISKAGIGADDWAVIVSVVSSVFPPLVSLTNDLLYDLNSFSIW